MNKKLSLAVKALVKKFLTDKEHEGCDSIWDVHELWANGVCDIDSFSGYLIQKYKVFLYDSVFFGNKKKNTQSLYGYSDEDVKAIVDKYKTQADSNYSFYGYPDNYKFPYKSYFKKGKFNEVLQHIMIALYYKDFITEEAIQKRLRRLRLNLPEIQDVDIPVREEDYDEGFNVLEESSQKKHKRRLRY